MGIIEVIVVSSIASVTFVALLAAAAFYLRWGLFSAEKVQALYLLEESAEIARFIRNDDYATLIEPLIGVGPVHLEQTGAGWVTTATPQSIPGGFVRTIEFTEVYRRSSDHDIVPASSPEVKAVDSKTVRMTARVDWGSGAETLTTYLTDLAL